MKHLLFIAVLVPSLLIAQSAPPGANRIAVRPSLQTPGKEFADNYQLTLIVTDKDGQPVEISVVVASAQFVAALGEPSLSFAGTLTVEEAGGILVNYTLGWETLITVGNGAQYKSSRTEGSVRLKLGEEVQILRAGARTARLSIKKLDGAK